jgi:esterase/lipase superfamily enzyme
MVRQMLLASLVVLSGCGHPTGVMTPITLTAAMPKTSQVTMLVATTRQPSGDPATLFNGERSPKPYLTDISVSIPPARQTGTVQWPKRLPPNPATDFAVTHVKQISTVADGRAWFHAHIEDGHAVVFVHGFNNTYEESVFKLAQIVHDSGMHATPFLFTWPSRASVFGYEYDKESTNYSRTALEQSLRILIDDPAVKDITILAHSMGTWLAMESLRQMGIRDGHVSAKIKNVILASPDIDIQVFAKQFVEMGSPKPKFTIFVSQDDRALAASSLITGRVARLGGINPAVEPYRTKLEQAGITAIDLTKVRSGDSMNHGKFAESPAIVQLIGQHILTGQTLTGSSVSVGSGVAAVIGGTVGRMATAAASAPFAVYGRSAKADADDVANTLQNAQQAKPLTP